jgi:putative transposase
MKILKGFKYRLRPNRKHRTCFSQFSGCARYVYNQGLERRQQVYEKEKKTLSHFDQNKELTIWREELDWLRACHSQILQQSLKDLDRAFEHTFRRLKKGEQPGFPRFKRKGDGDSFRYPQGFKVEGDKVYLPKIGWVRFRKSRELEGEIKQVTIIREGTHWYVSFSVEIDKAVTEVVPTPERTVGIDLGCQTFAKLAIGEENLPQEIYYPKYLKQALCRLRRYNHILSKKVYKSQNYFKFRNKLAKLHRSIRDARADFLHKVSTDLIQNHDQFFVEDLHVKEMLEEGHESLHRVIADSGWRKFLDFLEYKALEWGKHLRKLSPYFPSTQICSSCGQKKKLALTERVYSCDSCGLTIDRDYNAAINLKAAGASVVNACRAALCGAEAGISPL